MASNEAILAEAKNKFGESLLNARTYKDELTIDIDRGAVVEVCRELRDNPMLSFEQLIDLCGVDYSDYGNGAPYPVESRPRFAVVFHLLSVSNNHRLRVRVFLDENQPMVQSMVGIWPVADWFEREAFDLFGIIFEGHSDLRRILTDYGFIGHPFRKDFPLTGRVEMRYDPDKGRVVYQPVSIEPRTLVPRVIREEEFGDRNP